MLTANEITLWGFGMTILGTFCWVICFLWMHLISKKQNNMLDELRSQNHRIEELAKAEHDLIREVHPQVGEIREGLQAMVEAVQNIENSGDEEKPETTPKS